MEYTLTIYGCLCATKEFVINGISADSGDFGTQGDRNSWEAEDYACADMQFNREPATQTILDKYGISLDEYDTIASELEDRFSFGSCGWCV